MRFNTTTVEEVVRLGEEILFKVVDNFIYFGGFVTKKGGCDGDIKSRRECN